MAKICNPKCIFFPVSTYEKCSKNFTIDDNNVKHNSIKPYCEFDDHLIENWENCENYRKKFFEKHPKEKVVILLGKSAAGKDYILNYLKKSFKFNSIISHTTRPIRENETNGLDYYFINKKTFSKMLKNNEFIEIRKYTTCFNGKQDVWSYGITKKEFDNKTRKICVVDTTGLREIIKYYGKENVISIYIDVEDKIREKRAKIRGSFSQSEWDRRLKDDGIKFLGVEYDYIIQNNGTKEQYKKNIENILRKENIIG